jgi:hypothetical protein
VAAVTALPSDFPVASVIALSGSIGLDLGTGSDGAARGDGEDATGGPDHAHHPAGHGLVVDGDPERLDPAPAGAKPTTPPSVDVLSAGVIAAETSTKRLPVMAAVARPVMSDVSNRTIVLVGGHLGLPPS